MILLRNLRSLFAPARQPPSPPPPAPESAVAKTGKRRSGFIASFSRYALHHHLLVIAYGIIRLYFLTIRIRAENEESVLRHLRQGGKLIAALWHQRILTVIGYARRFSTYRPSVMISASRDGDLIASIFSRMHFRPIRGSSSLNGKKALLALVDDLSANPFAVHILDGPQGPRGVIKPGVIVLARQSGAPVIPVYASVDRAWILRSWDRCLVPKPFSKIVIHWGQPIVVPPDINEETFEEIRSGLEKRMLQQQRECDHRYWRENLI